MPSITINIEPEMYMKIESSLVILGKNTNRSQYINKMIRLGYAYNELLALQDAERAERKAKQSTENKAV